MMRLECNVRCIPKGCDHLQRDGGSDPHSPPLTVQGSGSCVAGREGTGLERRGFDHDYLPSRFLRHSRPNSEQEIGEGTRPSVSPAVFSRTFRALEGCNTLCRYAWCLGRHLCQLCGLPDGGGGLQPRRGGDVREECLGRRHVGCSLRCMKFMTSCLRHPR